MYELNRYLFILVSYYGCKIENIKVILRHVTIA